MMITLKLNHSNHYCIFHDDFLKPVTCSEIDAQVSFPSSSVRGRIGRRGGGSGGGLAGRRRLTGDGDGEEEAHRPSERPRAGLKTTTAVAKMWTTSVWDARRR
ncbi:hypothetical protein E2C01_069343 [Portunus trituberculatus]|uniref:Uncharacterized protein n=1 Tax=Portunus trituberculatus TaxID=210409 RepID=A0A5B7HRB5_PORTR|nr:hypothetical protein [Portunus trituberculatus]